jgi:hypothetical protein
LRKQAALIRRIASEGVTAVPSGLAGVRQLHEHVLEIFA